MYWRVQAAQLPPLLHRLGQQYRGSGLTSADQRRLVNDCLEQDFQRVLAHRGAVLAYLAQLCDASVLEAIDIGQLDRK
jgi:hypothetical protein